MSPADRRSFLRGSLATAAAAVLAPACSASSANQARSRSTTTPASVPTADPFPSGLDPRAFADQATMTGWIEAIIDQGIRRPGYAADAWTEQEIARQFRAFGLEDVRLEPVEVTRWEPTRATLRITPATGERRDLACFAVPYAVPTSGLTAELVPFDPDAPGAVTGRAALVDARVVRLPADALAGAGSAPADLTGRTYDPDGTLAGDEHVLPHTADRRRVLDGAIAAGAVAVIGALLDHPGGGHEYFVPYDGEPRPVPGVWIGDADGAWLHDQLAAGPVQVHLVVEATSIPATSHNVVGTLAGADDELVVIGSHHDGPWASAVEDASGTALVLAQARFWSAQPADRRPHRLVFVVHAGHMCGSAGLDAYLAAHADDLSRTVLEVHLEHAALEAEERDGQLVATDRCTPRWFFATRHEPLEAAVIEAINTEDLRRSLVLAPDALGDNPPTDGGLYHRHGVPVVQFLAAPSYLFDRTDTVDKVDVANLVPLSRAAARIVASTRGTSAAAMRAST